MIFNVKAKNFNNVTMKKPGNFNLIFYVVLYVKLFNT